jgi:uncharacterized protein
LNECFYENGLKFECTQCSKCCRFDPGYVFLSYKDLNELVEYFKLPPADIKKKYCRTVEIGGHKRLSLIEKSHFDCIFWSNGACQIYEARPLQCRTYPFWKPFLINKKSWDAEAESCPGMNHGKTISKEEIENWVKKRDLENYIVLD